MTGMKKGRTVMDMIFDLIIECIIDIITDNGVDVMTGSDRTKNLSKGAKIALVVVSLLIFAAIAGLLLFFGFGLWAGGDITTGIPLTLLGAVFIIFTAVKLIMSYRKNRSSKKDRS